jgi:hypothetical protein
VPSEASFVPATDLTLYWATFSDAADQAGISRRYGGIHFVEADVVGRSMGRAIAAQSWDKAQTYTSPPARYRHGASIEDLEAANPNVRSQYVVWNVLRTQRGEDPFNYQDFRQHLMGIGAPDPGVDESPDFPVGTLSQ